MPADDFFWLLFQPIAPATIPYSVIFVTLKRDVGYSVTYIHASLEILDLYSIVTVGR